jgi:site-specific DNA recombinase
LGVVDAEAAGVQVAIYARVSTDEQAREGFSIPAQRDRLLAFCVAQGWTVADIYQDEGWSGAKLDRPALARLRKDAQAKRFDVVLAWKVDRLTRKVGHLAALIDELDHLGVAFRSVTEPFDTSHAAGRAFMQMLGVFAELERENIRERSKLGIRKRVESGYIHGRPAPIGYRNVAKGVWEVVPEEATVVQWIAGQYLAGRGALKLAQTLKSGAVDGLSSQVIQEQFGGPALNSVVDRIRWIVRNPVYAGYAPLGEELHPGRHEAIIDPAAWSRLQDLIDRRQRTPNRAHTSRYLLSQRVWCAECGSPMYGRREPGRGGKRPYREYYVCGHGSSGMGVAAPCGNWGIDRERAENEALGALRQLAVTGLPAVVEDSALDELQRRRGQVVSALDGLERRRRKLFRALEEAPDLEDELLSRMRELSDEQRRLSADLAAVERELRSGGASVSPEEVAALLRDIPRVLDAADPDQVREILRVFVRRVIVHPRGHVRGGRRCDPKQAPKAVTVEFYSL